ncbi:MAG TPA: uracil-DNA glycosylase family protein [Flavobacteriaceae bacterium]|nr:uracil-DNA glycosylase family protein [Flavobacteriaceae bacterium]
MSTFANRVIDFHKNLNLQTELPAQIQVLNPYKDNRVILKVLKEFYGKYFDDQQSRKLIVGINPGRLGGGATGIPFTDTKRLSKVCGIDVEGFKTHEPSSVFVYKVIEAFGGPEKFYQSFYINSVCPLGFVRQNKKANWVNCNYYDDKTLFEAVKPFIIDSLKTQIRFGIDTSVCYSFGKKNAQFLAKINKEEKLFDRVVDLPHPRYIIQYKSKQKDMYIDQYLETLR